MASPVVIAAGVAAAAGVGGFLWWRKKQAEKATGPTACDGLGALAGDLAGLAGASPESASKLATAACNLGGRIIPSGVGDAFKHLIGSGPSKAEKLAHNARLNGQVVDRVAPGFPPVGAPIGQLGKGLGMSWSGNLRYQNGCRPYKGHPDYAKCAPGTFPESGVVARLTDKVGQGQIAPSSGDPFSFKHPAGVPFPLPVPAGATAYFINGKPQVCNAGSSLAIDHRTGQPVPVCSTDYGAPTGPRGSAPDDTFVETPRTMGGTTRDHRG